MLSVEVDSIELVSVLSGFALFQSVCDLKATQMNMQREVKLYETELSHNTAKATKNIYCTKGEVDHNEVTRKLKKFHSGCKNLDVHVGLKPWILWPYTEP